MTKNLFVVSLGPVQSFIAAARKAEDLWSGSYVLSYLTETAMTHILDEGEKRELAIKMVYPVVSLDSLTNQINDPYIDIASLPNRFLAIAEGNRQLLIDLLNDTRVAVHKALEELCITAIRRVFPPEVEYEHLDKLVKNQVTTTLEFFWAVESFTDEAAFENARLNVEKRLAAVKNNRTYMFHKQSGLICNVCGEREALCDQLIHPNDTIKDIKEKMETLWRQRVPSFRQYKTGDAGEGRINDREYLCGICLGKRASLEYFQEIKNAKHAFERFKSTTSMAGHVKYYSVLMMDGDNMGQWFSGKGELSERANDETPIERYRLVSERLRRFAKETVPQYVVKKYKGELVYAGGDDVLAFVPMSDALSLARDLRLAFSDPKQGLAKGATASIGIVIAHYKDPLYNTLNKVREMEKMAKSYERTINGKTKQKDALALAYLARSGEVRQVVMPWSLENDTFTANDGDCTVTQLNKLIDAIGRDVSSTFLYSFGQAFLPLVSLEGKLSFFENDVSLNDELLSVEFRRLIGRALKESGVQLDVSKLTESLVKMHRAIPHTFQFIQLLEILRNIRVKLNGNSTTQTG